VRTDLYGGKGRPIGSAGRRVMRRSLISGFPPRKIPREVGTAAPLTVLVIIAAHAQVPHRTDDPDPGDRGSAARLVVADPAGRPGSTLDGSLQLDIRSVLPLEQT